MTDWRERASCLGEDPDLFFPVTKAEEVAALVICSACPVQVECATFAQTSNRGHREQFGVWAGRNYEKKERPRRRAKVVACEICETRWLFVPTNSHPAPRTCSAKCRRDLESRTKVRAHKLKATG